jgi:CRISPR/Cas system-associated exonuclease Cas4 (RecB family)
LLPLIYRELNAELIKGGVGYEGMIYRNVAEMDLAELSEKLQHEHYTFVGFNALSSSEKKLFSVLKKKDAASFFWDYDEQYIQDESMEAGRFLRENLKLFPPPLDLGIFSSLKNGRNIRIFDLPSDVLQAKTVHQLISERDSSIEEANDTAIIACNENLLMPILFSLPEQVDLVNITMGYPFSSTPLSSFIDSLLRVQRNVRISKAGKVSFYHRDVLSVLNHQYFKLVSQENPSKFVRSIIRENRVYIDAKFFSDGFASIIFSEIKTVTDLCAYLEQVLRFILNNLLEEDEGQKRELEKEYVLVMLSRLNKLSEITSGREDLEKITFMKLFKKIMFNLRIPFTGEPLAGLQIMGILETRLLDFENVVMLSVNEDVMPRSSAGHSFIPNSMRYAYNLPTREDMDAIYAYYFYRLIQRSKKVDLLFKSASEGVNTGEMSRYLYQMKYDYSAKIIRPVLPVTSSENKTIEIHKTPEIMAIMNKYLEGEKNGRYLSPSSLNTYIECPLKFYFRKIVNVREQDELLEELDAIGFGNILHKTIHHLYDALKEGKNSISSHDLELLMKSKELEEHLLNEFRKEYFKSDKDRELEGRNLIIFAILKKYLLKIIETDAKIAPLEFLDLEEDFHSVREIETEKEKLRIALGGQIDRVDRTSDGITRIIDYKTGNPDLKFSSIASLFDHEQNPRNKEAFQAFVYASLYLEKNPDHIVQPGLYVVRKLFGKEYSPIFEMREGKGQEPIISFNQYLEMFNENMESLLKQIFDPNIPFSQTTIVKRCEYCDFKGICQRS